METLIDPRAFDHWKQTGLTKAEILRRALAMRDRFGEDLGQRYGFGLPYFISAVIDAAIEHAQGD